MSTKRPSLNTIWLTRPIGKYPQIYIRAAAGILRREIHLTFAPSETAMAYTIAMSRLEARLLARRINECLEATK